MKHCTFPCAWTVNQTIVAPNEPMSLFVKVDLACRGVIVLAGAIVLQRQHESDGPALL